MTTPHTPPPWIITEVNRNTDCLEWVVSIIRSATDSCKANPRIAVFDEMGGSSLDVAEGRANAQRAVACVNACEGINPDAVPDLLTALQNLSEWGRTHTSPLDKNSPHVLLVAAHFALAKADPSERSHSSSSPINQ